MMVIMKKMIVFPACAGVILLLILINAHSFSFPRMRGGDPWSVIMYSSFNPFSPHARG